MGVFSKAFWGAAIGKTIISIVLLVLATIGFGLDYWVRYVMTWWHASPADAAVTVLRLVGTVIGVLCILILAIAYLWPLIRPRKFVAVFDRNRDIHAGMPQFDLRTGTQLADRGTYVHLHVESVRGAQVIGCVGAITSLEKLDANGNVIANVVGTRQLIWAPREHGMIQQTIAPNLPQDLDIFKTIENTNQLEVLCVGHPPSWLQFFNTAGRYRITVVVSGADRTQTVKYLIDWRGKWDDFDLTVE